MSMSGRKVFKRIDWLTVLFYLLLVGIGWINIYSSTFSGNNGKLIFYHGVSDPWFSAFDTVDYYNQLIRDNGEAEKVRLWSRLFLVPGMGHCSGGEKTVDSFDIINAIVN